jgi:AmmeMemoRadiSam system protein B
MAERAPVRRTAVAGTWYPGARDALEREVDRHLDAAASALDGDLRAVIAPHAGLMYSGPVAACAYRLLRGRAFDAIVLVGPSHYVGFDGVSIVERGAFETPLGPMAVDEPLAGAIRARDPGLIRPLPTAHEREHSLEMQLPFLKRLAPDTPIVPMVMGYQTRATVVDLAAALEAALRPTRALLVASTDLSHFFDAPRANALDARTCEFVRRLDPDGLLAEFESYPEHERGRYVA